jgi:hypothetical protein
MLALLLLVARLPALVFASGQNEDLPLQIHIVRVDMAQGKTFTLDGAGGQSYLYHVYIVHVDGDPRELSITTGVGRRFDASLHLGDYKGRWNKDRSLLIQFWDEKGKLQRRPFFIRAESPLKPEQQTEGKQPAQ